VVFEFLVVDTRFGEMSLVWSVEGGRPLVHRVVLPGDGPLERVRDLYPGARAGQAPSMLRLARWITRFTDGDSHDFPLAEAALDTCGAFQRSVLVAEHGIPRGRVSTYGRIAAHLGRPRGARAVGRALATNPFPIIVPCHRAVRSDGSLGGYQGGVAMKRALLELEGLRFDSRDRLDDPKMHY
jgi:methylated-DNA-[protein]-cysteine S-methyltransferase